MACVYCAEDVPSHPEYGCTMCQVSHLTVDPEARMIAREWAETYASSGVGASSARIQEQTALLAAGYAPAAASKRARLVESFMREEQVA